MDISGGMPSMIIQMLVASDLGRIKLLPALPTEWPSGTIEGVLCRGAIEVNRLHWDGKKVEVELTSKTDQEIKLVLPGKLKDGTNTSTVSLTAGKKASFSFELQ
jgi:hypothetical protein